jgi:hypothetical protein
MIHLVPFHFRFPLVFWAWERLEKLGLHLWDFAATLWSTKTGNSKESRDK